MTPDNFSGISLSMTSEQETDEQTRKLIEVVRRRRPGIIVQRSDAEDDTLRDIYARPQTLNKIVGRKVLSGQPSPTLTES